MAGAETCIFSEVGAEKRQGAEQKKGAPERMRL